MILVARILENMYSLSVVSLLSNITFLVVIMMNSLAHATTPADNNNFEKPIDSNNPLSYQHDDTWQKLQAYLPKKYQMTADETPQEALWQWQTDQIHVERYINPDASAKVILLHGVGTNSRQLSLIVGRPLAQAGFETVGLDLPPYGMSQHQGQKAILYDDWVNIVIDFIRYEQQRDNRPIILYGLSAGGMLAYHVAAKYPHVAGIVGMTFLDQRIQTVRDQTSKNLFMSRIGSPSALLASKTPLGNIKLPMKWVSKMDALVNDPEALELMLKDPRSAGNHATLKFLASYLYYQPAVEPEDFKACPILLAQPENDHWTPLELSKLTLDKIQHDPVQLVILHGAGHYPIEEQGLDALNKSMVQFINSIVLPQ